METCENCGRAIGNLETPQIWQEHVVCAECAGRLRMKELDYAVAQTSQRPARREQSDHDDRGDDYDEDGPRRGRRIQTIEQTGKEYKGAMVIAVLIVALGVFLAFSNPRSPEGGVILAFFGLVSLLVVRVAAWWNHG